jgi:hypothetical protein
MPVTWPATSERNIMPSSTAGSAPATAPVGTVVLGQIDRTCGSMPTHDSGTSQTPAAGRHGVPLAANASDGQAAPAPLHASATSHTPAAVRQTEPAATKPSGGHDGLDPVVQHAPPSQASPALSWPLPHCVDGGVTVTVTACDATPLR